MRSSGSSGRSTRERLDQGEHHRWLDEVLRKIQNELFDLGSELATPPGAEYEGMFKLGEAEVTALERLMESLPAGPRAAPLVTLPGGGRINAFCTRLEPSAAEPSGGSSSCRGWSRSESGHCATVNRLSDTFFVLGRWVAKHMGEREYLWERGLQGDRPRPGKKPDDQRRPDPDRAGSRSTGTAVRTRACRITSGCRSPG